MFVSLSLACGIYYLAELIEEFTLTTKRLIKVAIRAELALHALLLLDRLPLLNLALGVAAHVSYGRLLRRFPYLQLGGPDALAAAALLLASTAAWWRHFRGSFYTTEYVGAFLLVTTWLVPAAFLLSLAGDQAVLPGAGANPYAHASSSGSLGGGGAGGSSGYGGGGGGGGGQKQRRTLALRVFDLLRRKRDEALPGVARHLPPGFMKDSERMA